MPPNNATTIRQAVPEDATAIHTMVRQLARALDLSAQIRGSIDDLLKYGLGVGAVFNTLIAQRNRQPVGMCTYFPVFSTWTGRPGIFVLDLFVSENQRGS